VSDYSGDERRKEVTQFDVCHQKFDSILQIIGDIKADRKEEKKLLSAMAELVRETRECVFNGLSHRTRRMEWIFYFILAFLVEEFIRGTFFK
jgi:hypothetical protein